MKPVLMSLAQIGAVWGLVEELLGWIPCILLWQACRQIILSEMGSQRLGRQQGTFQLRLGQALFSRIPPCHHVKLLQVMALGPLLRLDDPTLTGMVWNGNLRPHDEVRVCIRYMHQEPRRRWSKLSGHTVDPGLLRRLLVGTPLAQVTEWLEEHGQGFRWLRMKTLKNAHGEAEDVPGTSLEILSLWVVLSGFEAVMRVTRAHTIDLEFPSPSSSSSEAS